MVNFTQIPNSTRVPGSYVEITPNQAASSGSSAKILVLGQRTTAGTVSALIPTLVTSVAQAIDNFGVGSMLAVMGQTLFNNNSTTEKWFVAMDDESGGTAASGTITFTASSAQVGTVSVYMGGVLVEASVALNDTATTIATALKNAINANVNLPVTANSSGAVITVTFKHKGLVGNKYDMRVNYKSSITGPSAGEALPSGVTIAFVQLANGATDPALTDAFAVLPDQVYDFILCPYIGSANLNNLDTELNSRWLATRALEGHCFVADKGSVSTVGTLGQSRNNQHMSLLDAAYNSPTPPYIWVSALVGQVASAAAVDPASPFTGLPLYDVLPSPLSDRRTKSECETLLYDGVATHNVADNGVVSIQRLTTTFQTNSSDFADPTYLDSNTVFTLARLRQSFTARMSSRFARFKLADNGTSIAAGQNIVTPAIIKGEVVALAQQWALDGWIEDLDGFISTLSVTRNATDLSRVDCVMYPNLVNQFQVFATQISFKP